MPISYDYFIIFSGTCTPDLCILRHTRLSLCGKASCVRRIDGVEVRVAYENVVIET